MFREYWSAEERKEYNRLKKLRKRAHAVFDPLWQSGTITRKEAYILLEDLLQLKPHQAHISMLSAKECLKLIHRIESGRFKTEHLRKKAEKRRRVYNPVTCRLESRPLTNA